MKRAPYATEEPPKRTALMWLGSCFETLSQIGRRDQLGKAVAVEPLMENRRESVSQSVTGKIAAKATKPTASKLNL